MEGLEEASKMKSMSPFKFYGEDAPRKLSNDPKQIVKPLMEWAQKAHWKNGGLAGHGVKSSTEGDRLPLHARPAREFYYEDRIKQLGMLPTREEALAMKGDLLIAWQRLPLEERQTYEVMESEDLVRFEEEMEEYKSMHPEYEKKILLKEVKRKRSSEMRAFRRSKKMRRDAKVELSETDASDCDQETGKKPGPQIMCDTTPKRPSGYTGDYEFQLSPRSIRRAKRDALKRDPIPFK